MTINSMVRYASAGLVGLVVTSAVVFFFAVNAIRIGGSHGRQMEVASELGADILPPPLFVVEPYAVAMEGFLHEEKRTAAIQRLKQLRREYGDRRERWRREALNTGIRAGLSRVEAQADRFWVVLDEQALPVMVSGDRSRFDAAFEALASAYNVQRIEIARLLQHTSALNEKVRREAALALWVSALVLGALAVALLASVLFYSRLVRRRIVVPLSELTECATLLSSAQPAQVPHRDRADELGLLAHAFDHFIAVSAEREDGERRNAARQKEMVDRIAAILIRIAEGGLREVDRFEGDYGVLGENLNSAIHSLRAIVGQVVTGASSIRLAASEIAAASHDLSNRTQSNAASIEQTSAALTDVDRRVASTRDAAQSTAEAAERARSAVEHGLAKARSAAATMEEVRDTAASIDGVMEALDKIAFQTRVLAMNAAVEAGHAGEVGKGFAVIADLVSQLAARAEDEARRAREQLTATTERISFAAAGVGEVETQFNDIVADVSTVTELIDRLSADARAQAHAVGEISAAMQVMDRSTQQNAAMVEQTSAAAAQLLGSAGQLVEHAGKFRWDRADAIVAPSADWARAA